MDKFERVQPSAFAGSATWHTIYCYITKYVPTSQNKKIYKRWLECMLMLFPCEKCSQHAMETYKKHNIDHYLDSADRLYLYVSMILQEGANDNKGIPHNDRPEYYERKRFFFESMNGSCDFCSLK